MVANLLARWKFFFVLTDLMPRWIASGIGIVMNELNTYEYRKYTHFYTMPHWSYAKKAFVVANVLPHWKGTFDDDQIIGKAFSMANPFSVKLQGKNHRFARPWRRLTPQTSLIDAILGDASPWIGMNVFFEVYVDTAHILIKLSHSMHHWRQTSDRKKRFLLSPFPVTRWTFN